MLNTHELSSETSLNMTITKYLASDNFFYKLYSYSVGFTRQEVNSDRLNKTGLIRSISYIMASFQNSIKLLSEFAIHFWLLQLNVVHISDS